MSVLHEFLPHTLQWSIFHYGKMCSLLQSGKGKRHAWKFGIRDGRSSWERMVVFGMLCIAWRVRPVFPSGPRSVVSCRLCYEAVLQFYLLLKEFFPDGAAPPHGVFQELRLCRVQCKKRELKDVHVPIPRLSSRPEPAPTPRGSDRDLEDTEEGLVEWDDRVQSLFEWVGMACLGAQRFDFVRVFMSQV